MIGISPFAVAAAATAFAVSAGLLKLIYLNLFFKLSHIIINTLEVHVKPYIKRALIIIIYHSYKKTLLLK